jgi:ribonuclease BN (tRNA processing enzyme)
MEFVCTLLGSGTGVPWRSRNPPGLVLAVESDDRSRLALIDPSAGSCQRLVSRGYDLEQLTHVLVTHFHPDHTGDLAPLLFALRNPSLGEVGAREPLELVGPVGLGDLLAGLEAVYDGWIDIGGRRRIRELERTDREGFFTVGAVEVTWFPVEHTEHSLAFRFESRAGKVLAYSGDTDVCDGIVEAARDADVLVLDCAFPEGRKCPGHLVPSEAGWIATAANVRKLILTHLYPECDGEDLLAPCRRHFSGDVVIAEDGLTVNL